MLTRRRDCDLVPTLCISAWIVTGDCACRWWPWRRNLARSEGCLDVLCALPSATVFLNYSFCVLNRGQLATMPKRQHTLWTFRSVFCNTEIVFRNTASVSTCTPQHTSYLRHPQPNPLHRPHSTCKPFKEERWRIPTAFRLGIRFRVWCGWRREQGGWERRRCWAPRSRSLR